MDDGIVLEHQSESRALTGLRGVGALMVMLHHFYLHLALHTYVPALGGLMLKGYLGVDLFFVLSGFVMAMVYGSWFPGEAVGRARRVALFLVRRVARIWPLHVAVLAATMALAWSVGDVFSARTVLANVAMVQAWGISSEINVPAWSISAEFVAYLLFPLLAALVLRGRGGLWLGLLGIAALLAVAMTLAPPIGNARRGQLDIYYNYSMLPVLRCLAGFTLGLVAWRLGQGGRVRRACSSAAVGPLALVLVLMLMLAKANDLLIYPLLPLVVLGFHFGHGVVWRGFASGPLYRLGVLSYSLYLVHYTLLSWFPFGWAPLRIELLVFLLAATAVAMVAHHAIELPVRRLMRAGGSAALSALRPPLQSPPPLQPGPG